MAAGAVTISLVILLLAGTYTFRQQQHVNSELCASTVENRAADRVQWITLRKLTLPTIESDAEREDFKQLIDGVLRPIPLLTCVNNKPVLKEER
jgi:hypothetical protein